MQAQRLIAAALLLGGTAAMAGQSSVARQPERRAAEKPAAPPMVDPDARERMLEARRALAAEAYDERYYGDRFDADARDDAAPALSGSARGPLERR